jgi:hypothetical protein
MAYVITNPGYIGTQPIAVTDTVKRHLTGTIIQAQDPVYGSGEFIYLLGVASTTIGDVVTFVTSDGVTQNGSTTRWAGTAITPVPLAVAMSANVSGQYGWYQIQGSAVVNASGTVAAGDKAHFQATAQVTSTVVASKQVIGMIASSAQAVPVSGQAIYILERPSAQSAIT